MVNRVEKDNPVKTLGIKEFWDLKKKADGVGRIYAPRLCGRKESPVPAWGGHGRKEQAKQ